MKNVTITVDEKVARWARIRAARENTSVSRLVGDLLRRLMIEEAGYQAAMKQFLAVKPTILKTGGAYPNREVLHDRHRLR